MGEIRVGARVIELSNADKVFFPDAGLTKADVVDYYRRVAEVMVRHLRDRPLTMERFPDGLSGESFIQKETPDHFPEWISRAVLPRKEDGVVTYVLCNDAATLVYLATQACLTPHVWLSRTDAPEHPDRLIFDVDPPGDDFEPVRTTARRLEALLADLGLGSYVMTTGSSGLHVVVPLDRSADFDVARGFARAVADVLARRDPETVTTEQRKDQRRGRLFLDTLRNAYAQTGVAPYAIRARPGAPVATPIDWEELARADLGPRTYTLQNVFRRLGQKDDPWADIGRHGQSLDGPRQRLERLGDE